MGDFKRLVAADTLVLLAGCGHARAVLSIPQTMGKDRFVYCHQVYQSLSLGLLKYMYVTVYITLSMCAIANVSKSVHKCNQLMPALAVPNGSWDKY